MEEAESPSRSNDFLGSHSGELHIILKEMKLFPRPNMAPGFEDLLSGAKWIQLSL